MVKLAHISDIHLAPLPKPRWWELIGKRITGYLNWQKNRDHRINARPLAALMLSLREQLPDHTVISGDLVNLSLQAEFSAMERWLCKEGSGKDIFLTLGNHDAYVCGAFDQACRMFAPWIEGERAPETVGAFPVMRVVGDVAVIAVSSALATPPFCAAGYFDVAQEKSLGWLLEAAAARGLFRVVMIHHPPFMEGVAWHRKLWGVQRFWRVIRNYGCELILHGHTHEPSLYYVDAIRGSPPVVGVASASQSFGGVAPAASFNLFHIDRGISDWSCCLQRYQVLDAANTIGLVEEIDLSCTLNHC